MSHLHRASSLNLEIAKSFYAVLVQPQLWTFSVIYLAIQFHKNIWDSQTESHVGEDILCESEVVSV